MSRSPGAELLCPNGHVSAEPDYCSVCGAAIGGRAATAGGGTPGSGRPPTLEPLAGSTGAGPAAGAAGSCPTCGTPRSDAGDRFCEVCRYDFESGTPGPPPVVSPTPADPSARPGAGPAAGDPTPGDPSARPGAGPAASDPQGGDPSARPGAGPAASDPQGGDPGAASGAADPGAAAAAAGTGSPPGGPAGGHAGAWSVTIEIDPTLDVEPDPASPPPVGQTDRLFPIDLPEMLIGRRDDRQDIRPEIPIRDPAVSRRHAKLLLLPDGGLAVLDLASANGTAVNGEETPAGERHQLNDGDTLTMGRWTRITVHHRL